MPKSRTFSRHEQLLRMAIPFFVIIFIMIVLFWLGSKIIQGIVYIWNLINWNSINHWFTLHFWFALGTILLIVVILYLVRQIPRIGKSKSATPKPLTSPSSKKSGPRWDAYVGVAVVVFTIFYFQGYFQGCGRAHGVDIATEHTRVVPKEISWPTDQQMAPLRLGECHFVPGVWYTYTRDETSLMFMKAMEPSLATLTVQKLGSERDTYLKQRFNEYGSCKTIEDHSDGSPGKWYITTDQPVRVRITGTISK